MRRLNVKSYHEESNHSAGTNHTLSLLSARFWIVQAREDIREVEREGCECRRRQSEGRKVDNRPTTEDPTKIALVCANRRRLRRIISDRTGKGQEEDQVLPVFIDMLAVTSVYLEMAYGLDTGSFLNASFHMTNRRGLPERMMSDNGSNFVVAERELRELVGQLDQNRITSAIANRGVKWNFNPPSGSPF